MKGVEAIGAIQKENPVKEMSVLDVIEEYFNYPLDGQLILAIRERLVNMQIAGVSFKESMIRVGEYMITLPECEIYRAWIR